MQFVLQSFVLFVLILLNSICELVVEIIQTSTKDTDEEAIFEIVVFWWCWCHWRLWLLVRIIWWWILHLLLLVLLLLLELIGIWLLVLLLLLILHLHELLELLKHKGLLIHAHLLRFLALRIYWLFLVHIAVL